jgi:hypothetical protein
MIFEDLAEAQSNRPEKEANELAKKNRKGGEPKGRVSEQTAEAAPSDIAAEPAGSPFPMVEIQHIEGLLVPGCRVAPITRDVVNWSTGG